MNNFERVSHQQRSGAEQSVPFPLLKLSDQVKELLQAEEQKVQTRETAEGVSSGEKRGDAMLEYFQQAKENAGSKLEATAKEKGVWERVKKGYTWLGKQNVYRAMGENNRKRIDRAIESLGGGVRAKKLGKAVLEAMSVRTAIGAALLYSGAASPATLSQVSTATLVGMRGVGGAVIGDTLAEKFGAKKKGRLFGAFTGGIMGVLLSGGMGMADASTVEKAFLNTAEATTTPQVNPHGGMGTTSFSSPEQTVSVEERIEAAKAALERGPPPTGVSEADIASMAETESSLFDEPKAEELETTPVTPTATLETTSAPYVIAEGDTMWGVLGEKLALTDSQKATFLQKLTGLPEAERVAMVKEFGIGSGDIDLIRPGEAVSLEKIQSFLSGNEGTVAAADSSSVEQAVPTTGNIEEPTATTPPTEPEIIASIWGEDTVTKGDSSSAEQVATGVSHEPTSPIPQEGYSDSVPVISSSALNEEVQQQGNASASQTELSSDIASMSESGPATHQIDSDELGTTPTASSETVAKTYPLPETGSITDGIEFKTIYPPEYDLAEQTTPTASSETVAKTYPLPETESIAEFKPTYQLDSEELDAAPTATASSEATVEKSYPIQRGDTMQSILGEKLALNDSQKTVFLQKITGLPEAQRIAMVKDFGIGSGNLDLIRPGETVNLQKIQNFLSGGEQTASGSSQTAGV